MASRESPGFLVGLDRPVLLLLSTHHLLGAETRDKGRFDMILDAIVPLLRNLAVPDLRSLLATLGIFEKTSPLHSVDSPVKSEQKAFRGPRRTLLCDPPIRPQSDLPAIEFRHPLTVYSVPIHACNIPPRWVLCTSTSTVALLLSLGYARLFTGFVYFSQFVWPGSLTKHKSKNRPRWLLQRGLVAPACPTNKRILAVPYV